MATGPLRILLVVVGLALGAFVLANAFPSGEATVAPSNVPVETPTDEQPAEGESPPAEGEPDGGDGGAQQPGAQGVRVQVLNGTDESGLAERTATRIEALGFEDVSFGDAETNYDDTTIFYRDGFREQARELKDEVYPEAVLQGGTAGDAIDITVILGTDYTRAGT